MTKQVIFFKTPAGIIALLPDTPYKRNIGIYQAVTLTGLIETTYPDLIQYPLATKKQSKQLLAKLKLYGYTNINPHYYNNYIHVAFDYIDCIRIHLSDLPNLYHTGDCYNDINEALKNDWYKHELNNLNPEAIRKELYQSGAWNEEELQDNEANKQRILWIAAGNAIDTPEYY